MNRRCPLVMSLLLVTVLGAACAKKETGVPSAWQCENCRRVFLAEPRHGVVACPKDGSTNVVGVLGFECPTDHTKFLVPITASQTRCPQCGASTSMMIPVTPQMTQEFNASAGAKGPNQPEPGGTDDR